MSCSTYDIHATCPHVHAVQACEMLDLAPCSEAGKQCASACCHTCMLTFCLFRQPGMCSILQGASSSDLGHLVLGRLWQHKPARQEAGHCASLRCNLRLWELVMLIAWGSTVSRQNSSTGTLADRLGHRRWLATLSCCYFGTRKRSNGYVDHWYTFHLIKLLHSEPRRAAISYGSTARACSLPSTCCTPRMGTLAYGHNPGLPAGFQSLHAAGCPWLS